MATLSNPTLYSDSRLHACGWRTFCIELLCGVHGSSTSAEGIKD